MLHSSGLPKFLWGEAINHAVYLKNRTGTKALEGKTPYEVFYNVKPNLKGLLEFGALVWVHNPNGTKLDGRSFVRRWVGFDKDSSRHCMYSPDSHTVSIEHSVKFDPSNVNVYLPQVIPIEEEWKLSIENLSKSPVIQPVVEEPIKPIDTVDPLREDF